MGGNVIVIQSDSDWKAKQQEAAAAGKTVRRGTGASSHKRASWTQPG